MGALAAVAPVFGLVVTVGLILGGSAAAGTVGPVGNHAQTALRAASPIVAPTPTLVAPTPTLVAPTPTLVAPTPTLVAPTAPSAEEELAAQLARQLPDAKVVGNKIVYAGGAAVFIAIDAGVLSFSSCPSDRLCIWDQSNFQGSFWSLGTAGTVVAVPAYFGQVGSLWNNRSGRTLMFPSVAAAFPIYCYGAGVWYTTVTGPRASLRGAFLSPYPTC